MKFLLVSKLFVDGVCCLCVFPFYMETVLDVDGEIEVVKLLARNAGAIRRGARHDLVTSALKWEKRLLGEIERLNALRNSAVPKSEATKPGVAA